MYNSTALDLFIPMEVDVVSIMNSFDTIVKLSFDTRVMGTDNEHHTFKTDLFLTESNLAVLEQAISTYHSMKARNVTFAIHDQFDDVVNASVNGDLMPLSLVPVGGVDVDS